MAPREMPVASSDRGLGGMPCGAPGTRPSMVSAICFLHDSLNGQDSRTVVIFEASSTLIFFWPRNALHRLLTRSCSRRSHAPVPPVASFWLCRYVNTLRQYAAAMCPRGGGVLESCELEQRWLRMLRVVCFYMLAHIYTYAYSCRHMYIYIYNVITFITFITFLTHL